MAAALATGHRHFVRHGVPSRQAWGSRCRGQPGSKADNLIGDTAAFCREAQTDHREPNFKIQQMITLCKA